LDDELGDAKEVWASMHSGSVQGLNGGLLVRPRALRIVLPDPTTSALNSIADIVDVPVENLQRDVREVTRRLLAAGASVHWFNGIIGNAILISDPTTARARARVETILAFVPARARPSIDGNRETAPEFVDALCASFQGLVARSRPIGVSDI